MKWLCSCGQVFDTTHDTELRRNEAFYHWFNGHCTIKPLTEGTETTATSLESSYMVLEGE